MSSVTGEEWILLGSVLIGMGVFLLVGCLVYGILFRKTEEDREER